MKLAGILAADTSGEVLSVSNVMAAKSALAGVLGGHAITLAPLGLPDRYGRVVAQVFADGEWVQGALLRLGLALANPATADAACAAALRVAEDAGHASRDGHWADGRFAVRSPDRLQSRAGTFQIVEGAVATAAIVNGRAYLDFGADRKHGFTVTVAPADMRAFRQAKIDLRQLAGKRVQVRGWIELFKGPEMQIVSPDAIKGLDKD